MVAKQIEIVDSSPTKHDLPNLTRCAHIRRHLQAAGLCLLLGRQLAFISGVIKGHNPIGVGRQRFEPFVD